MLPFIPGCLSPVFIQQAVRHGPRVLLLLLIASTAIAGPNRLTLAEAERLALLANPSLAASQAQVEALSAVPSQVGVLPDPILALNAMNLPTDTFSLDQEAMTQVQVGITQPLPFPGKLGLRRAAAEREAAAAGQQLAEVRLALRASVRERWWQLFAIDRALEIVRDNQELMRGFIEVAQAKYTVGFGLQQDVLLAQLELSRLLDRELPLRSRREAAAAELNALLDRPAASAVDLPAEPPNARLPELPAVSDLLQQAVVNRPLLERQRALLAAARNRVDLAKRDFYPDFRLGAAYGFRDGRDRVSGKVRPDFLSLMFSFSVPIHAGSRQSKAVEQRSSELGRQRALLAEALRSVEAEISTSHARYRSAREQVRLFEAGILPQARQTVEAMLAGYQVDEVDFLNVVNAELRLFDAQIGYWDALAGGKQALARLAAAAGKEQIYE